MAAAAAAIAPVGHACESDVDVGQRLPRRSGHLDGDLAPRRVGRVNGSRGVLEDGVDLGQLLQAEPTLVIQLGSQGRQMVGKTVVRAGVVHGCAGHRGLRVGVVAGGVLQRSARPGPRADRVIRSAAPLPPERRRDCGIVVVTSPWRTA